MSTGDRYDDVLEHGAREIRDMIDSEILRSLGLVEIETEMRSYPFQRYISNTTYTPGPFMTPGNIVTNQMLYTAPRDYQYGIQSGHVEAIKPNKEQLLQMIAEMERAEQISNEIELKRKNRYVPQELFDFE